MQRHKEYNVVFPPCIRTTNLIKSYSPSTHWLLDTPVLRPAWSKHRGNDPSCGLIAYRTLQSLLRPCPTSDQPCREPRKERIQSEFLWCEPLMAIHGNWMIIIGGVSLGSCQLMLKGIEGNSAPKTSGLSEPLYSGAQFWVGHIFFP